MQRPLWVKIGLWSVPGRAGAWAYFWLSLALAAACVAYGFQDWRFPFFGVLLVFAALWYYLSIRWVDQHDRWS